ncbi:phospholipase Carboxylesterase superfamily protein [Rutstroemia sp. NJR-2017a BVV2]|nr:phospholipase Carboxylesterase superfamily protein [Rutstroemia sp. NJR-2017a BVV2]
MSPPRLPTLDDIPRNIVCDIVPSKDGKPTNALILLHGLGDTKEGFTQLARNLSLPQTTAISIQAPTPIPPLITGSDVPSFHWADDISFSSKSGSLDLDGDFTASIKVITSLVDALTTECHIPPRNIFFLGFGQGGMLALSLIASLPYDIEYGGVISIGGRLPEAVNEDGKGKKKTPVLIAGGNRKTEITRGALDRIRAVFVQVEYVKWEREGDGMMKGREEVLPLMRFWGRRLRTGAPEGTIEI